MRIDATVIDRLDRTSMELSAAVAAQLALQVGPNSGRVLPWDRGVLIGLGPGRYINRLVGLGTAEVSEPAAAIETFFASVGVPAAIEVSSWASPSLLELLATQHYVPSWARDVYGAVPARVAPMPPTERLRIESVDAGSFSRWLEVLADGNDLTTASGRATSDEFARARFAGPNGEHFLAYLDDQVAGAASLETAGGVGWLGGAATLPRFRRRGVQRGLLRHRLHLAATRGLDLVAATALPRGASARNLRAAELDLVATQMVCTQAGPDA